MKNAKPISKEMIEKFRKNYESDPVARVLTSAAANTDINELAYIPLNASKLVSSFSVELTTRGITNQKQSGRCWLFASMNVMREIVAEKCKLDKIELSGNYLAFWDKFEKINYFFETAIACADEQPMSRMLDWLMTGALSDGGQWDMMVSIVKKYGIVPATVMPETYQSCHTANLLRVINMKLRKDAIELRNIVNKGQDPYPRKEEMLQELFKSLCIVFGEPPEVFDFEYTDKDKKAHKDYSISPKQFFDKYVGLDLDQYVSVINSPTHDKPFNRSYTVRFLGNAVEGSVRYINLPMKRLKELAVAQMSAGEPVWFGSDSGKFGYRADGVWAPDAFDFGSLLGGLDLDLAKEERIDYKDSVPGHAMVLTGVNLDADGNTNRWKIENSWGEETGRKGYFVASDQWIDQFVYQVIIKKEYLAKEELAAYNDQPIVLEPWDPMGTLA